MSPRLVGSNHVALEVGDGDQFSALSEARGPRAGSVQPFGLVVDDKEAVRARLVEIGVEVAPGRRLNSRDPWGNLVQVVEYGQIQFTKAERILHGMDLHDLSKTPEAEAELAQKGLL